MACRGGPVVLCLFLLSSALCSPANAQALPRLPLLVPAAAPQEPAPATPGQVTPAQAPPAQAAPAAPPSKLNINVVEGAGAVNNIRTRALREFAVEVDDENDHAVPGAVVTFFAPNEGPGGTFAGDSQLLTVMTDKDGRAVAGSFRPNSTIGDYKIQVTSTYGDLTGTATISQSNQSAPVPVAKAHSNKKIAILVAAGAAVAVGAAVGLAGHGGSSSSSSTSTTTTATLGVGTGTTVGSPH